MFLLYDSSNSSPSLFLYSSCTWQVLVLIALTFNMLILFLLHSLSVLLILVYLCCRTYFQVCYKENHLGMKMLPSKLLQLWAAANMLLQCFSCTGLFVQNAMFAGAFQIPKFGANCCFIAMAKARSFSFSSSSVNYDARVYTFYL